MFLALFRGVTVMTLVGLPFLLYLLGGAILVLLLDSLVRTALWLARARRRAGPFVYRAWPDERGSLPVTRLVVGMVTVQFATLTAAALVGLLALGALMVERSLAPAFFQAWVLVVVAGAMAGIILSAAVRIERLVRWLPSHRRPIRGARPSGP